MNLVLSKITIQKACMSDIPEIFTLINYYARKELLLPRSLGALYETIRDFVIAREDAQLIGTGSLHITWENLAEIRSLAIAPKYTRQGIGRMLINFFKEEAQQLKIRELFALTYKPEFFKKCGFTIVPKSVFPQKVWVDCINCVKFPNCDEIAVKLTLP